MWAEEDDLGVVVDADAVAWRPVEEIAPAQRSSDPSVHDTTTWPEITYPSGVPDRHLPSRPFNSGAMSVPSPSEKYSPAIEP